LDLRADYNFYDDYVFYTTASYIKGDDITSGGHLPEISPLNGNVGIRFNLFDEIGADISSTIFARQTKVAAGELETPGYAVFNLSLNTKNIQLASANFRIFAGVENIFDKEYRNHLSTTRGLIVVEPGRNFYVKFVADF
jgi:hemoglobin/transferrin/lactoferrin receptor protein